MIKRFFYTGICLIGCLTFSACKTYVPEEDCINYDYSGCDTKEPLSGALHINLTIDDQQSMIPVSVYRGHFEDGELIWQDTLSEAEHILYVDLNNYYSVTALYISGEDTIMAIDGDEVRSSSVVNCDSTCWSVREGYTDVRLKTK